MTKIALNSGKEEKKEDTAEAGQAMNVVDLHDILTSCGLAVDEPDPDSHKDQEEEEEEEEEPPPLGIDWLFTERIAKTQIFLAIGVMAFLAVSMLVDGMGMYRMTSAFWTLYLLSTGYCGYRAGKTKSYAQAVGFTGMVTFQTLVYMSSMCWLIYAMFALHSHTARREEVSVLLTVGEASAMTGTVLTGLLALVACCKGFGRLLAAQERILAERREQEQTAENGAQPVLTLDN